MKKLFTLILLIVSTYMFGQNPKKILAVPGSTAYTSWACNGLQFYATYVEATNRVQIWRTDGTSGGTFPVTNFTGSVSVNTDRDRAAVVGNNFYFTLINNSIYELWKSDGTIAGTTQVDISPLTTTGGLIRANSTHVFLTSYFPFEDLYSIDNAGQVTFLQRLKNGGAYNALYDHAAIFRNKLVVVQSVFNAQGNPTNDNNFFVSDGTIAGSYTEQTILSTLPGKFIPCGDEYLLLQLFNIGIPQSLAKLPGIANGGIGNLEIFYTLGSGDNLKEYQTHPSAAYNTNGISTWQGNASVANSIFLSGLSDNHGWELWKTDGTAVGTVLVKDIYPGIVSGFNLWNGFTINGKFIFDGRSPAGNSRIYYSDGTATGTAFFPQAPAGLGELVCYYNGIAYFPTLTSTASGIWSVWQTDGTIENTLPVTPYYMPPGRVPFGVVGNGNIVYPAYINDGWHLSLLNPNFKLWNGSVDNNWNNTANWQGNTLPSLSENMLVPTNIPNYPLVNSNAGINSLWINWGNVTLANNAALNLNGELSVLINNSLAGIGSVNFSGTGDRVFDGIGIVNVSVTVTGGDVFSTGGNKTIPQLSFQSSNKLYLGNTDINITSSNGITGAANDRFIVTNGIGRLILPAIGTTASSTSALFPVGSSANSYTPVTITNNGTSQQFSVRTIDSLYSSYNTTYPESPATAEYTNSAVNKTWFINKHNNGQTVNATVQLQWNSGDELPGLNRSAIQLAHYSSNGWITGPSGSASGSGPYTFSRTGLSSFSPFGIANTNLTLPVNMHSFTAAYQDKKVKLQWKTSMEQNSSHFIIERSANAIDFTPIGRKEAFGTSTITALYDYTDGSPAPTTGFYRLRMYDLDNTYKLSNIVSVKPGMVKRIEIYPNPAKRDLQVQLASEWRGTVIFSVMDITGRILHTESLQKNTNNIGSTLDIASLAPGTYLFTAEFVDESKEVIRFVKR